MPRVYVSVGSNLEPERHVRAAVRALRERFGALAASPVYASAPVGFSGPEFLNLVVSFESGEPPESIAEALRSIEDTAGRRRDGPRFSDRTLDLDLILYGDRIQEGPGLRLPRTEVLEHAHVLGPLADLAPGEVHPRVGETYGAIWARFDRAAQTLRAVPLDLAADAGGPAWPSS
ncbi:MAG: 2-amino-4-hydroxy-6-hydroxymethyldihydropteridine diphosphokinase [Gammaproteobacteria bacterium]|nr:2-amino-4-hydroxy-6-hydroxymethyldihydropteridine diphosphokinase [Gammaproteobacteria bacterium]